MKKILFHTAVAALLCSLAACSPNQAEQQTNGRVKFSAKATMTPSATPAVVGQTVCADFTLQPVSINAAGNQTPAGAPVQISSTGTSQTDAILGCIDAQDPAINPNWGYQVTATHFVDCATGAAIPGLSPSVAFTNATVQCTAGKDMPLNIAVNVSIATPNAGGYIDISVSVNETDVQVGCKDADFVAGTSMLHFGESYIDPTGAIPLGLIGLDTGSPQQWAGTVSAGAPAVDSYYTGAIDIGQSNTSLIYQTFVSPCANGEQYADAQHAQCITNVKAPNGATTVASLADAFMESVNGFAAASVSADQSTINLISNYSAAPLLGDASVPKTNYNQGTKPASVSLTAPDVFTGVYVDQSTTDLFLVTALIGPAPGVPSVTSLTYGATGWVLGAWKALSTVTSAQIACHGLFTSPAGCFAPHACATDKAVCTPEQSKLLDSDFKQITDIVGKACTGTVAPSLAQLLGTNSTAEFCLSSFDTLCINAYLSYVGSVQCSALKPMSAACTLTRMEQGVICGCH
jgi:hypothetical protein